MNQSMQGASSGIGYGLKYQARCVADVKADTDHTSFITGTLSLKEENEVPFHLQFNSLFSAIISDVCIAYLVPSI